MKKRKSAVGGVCLVVGASIMLFILMPIKVLAIIVSIILMIIGLKSLSC